MRPGQLETLARNWLEYKDLAYLLPDPHGPEDIQGLIALYYPGGVRGFLREVPHSFETAEPVTWFKPRVKPSERVCPCGSTFETTLAQKRFCSEVCRSAARTKPRIPTLWERRARAKAALLTEVA